MNRGLILAQGLAKNAALSCKGDQNIFKNVLYFVKVLTCTVLYFPMGK